MSNAKTVSTIILNASDTKAFRAGESYPIDHAMEKARKLASRFRSHVIVETFDGIALASVKPGEA